MCYILLFGCKGTKKEVQHGCKRSEQAEKLAMITALIQLLAERFFVFLPIKQYCYFATCGYKPNL